jgi:hypothetical protein
LKKKLRNGIEAAAAAAAMKHKKEGGRDEERELEEERKSRKCANVRHKQSETNVAVQILTLILLI